VVLLDRDPGRRSQEGGTAANDLTPVMARLGSADLEIVDTLISAGIAPNRAEAIRWALARISERPAYARLRERTREIERLKSEF
jgi:Arc/MetJ-type ribon-helix-helix transcriptional regulator